MQGVYVGDDLGWKGERALLRCKHGTKGKVFLAQFDSLHMPLEFTHGWVPFYSYEFKLDKN